MDGKIPTPLGQGNSRSLIHKPMELPFTILDKDRWSRLNHPAELMCCRVAQGSKKDRLKKKVNAKAADNNASPRLNLAPSQDALVARMVSEEIRLDTLRWGLIPP